MGKIVTVNFRMVIAIKKSYVYLAFVALQALMLLFLLFKLKSDGFYLYATLEVVSILAAVAIAYSGQNPSIRISWIMVILLLPIFGLLIYIIFGNSRFGGRGNRKMKKIMTEGNKFETLHQHDYLQQFNIEDRFVKQVKYIESQTSRPLCSNTVSRYIPTGEDMLEHLADALNNAKRFIHIEFFIIERGVMWDKIEAILRQKASSGVEVRVLYDHAGSMDFVDRKWNTRLAGYGIEVGVFHRVSLFANKSSNQRNHRKIVVVDNEVGFTGGINIGDEYINKTNPYGYWKDTGIMLQGEAVKSLSLIFLNDWTYATKQTMDYTKYIDSNAFTDKDGCVQVFEVNPGMHGDTARNVMLNLISNADKYLYITTPYLVVDTEIITALCVAAKGGVDIRLIVPGTPDHKLVYIVTRSFFDELLLAGVKIYLYGPGFIHGKVVVADGKSALVGSINFDFRSFYLNYEVAALLIDSNTITEIEKDIYHCINESTLVDAQSHRNRILPLKLLEMVLRLFAPLM